MKAPLVGLRDEIVKRMGYDPASGEKFERSRDNLREALFEIMSRSKASGCITGQFHQIAKAALDEDSK